MKLLPKGALIRFGDAGVCGLGNEQTGRAVIGQPALSKSERINTKNI
jgi:hypothetical protein